MDVRVGPLRRFSTQGLMLLNLGAGEDSSESLGLQGNQTILKDGLNIRRTNIESVLNIGRTNAEAETPILWPIDSKNWLIGKDHDAGKDWRQEEKVMTGYGWMASLTQWTWVWVNSGRWWWTGRPGVLQSIGSKRVGRDCVTELKWVPAMWIQVPKWVLVGFESQYMVQVPI